MSNVPKGRQDKSRFEARHQLFKLRDEVTKLVLYDFGFSAKKYQEQIEKWQEWHKNDENCEEIVARMRQRCESFEKWFIDEEGRAVLDLMRRIEEEFTVGNSIYPSETPAKLIEFFVRRLHINKAIGLLYALKHEIHYVIRTLPVDINRYEPFAEAIDRQIALFKGVRKADNRLLRPRKKEPENTVETHMNRILDSVTALMNKLRGRITEADEADIEA